MPVGGHENGSVESAHGHLKRRICQALMLRQHHRRIPSIHHSASYAVQP